MRDVLADDLLDRFGIACGEGALGTAEHAIMDDHVTKQVDEHGYGAENIHRIIPPSGRKKPSLL